MLSIDLVGPSMGSDPGMREISVDGAHYNKSCAPLPSIHFLSGVKRLILCATFNSLHLAQPFLLTNTSMKQKVKVKFFTLNQNCVSYFDPS